MAEPIKKRDKAQLSKSLAAMREAGGKPNAVKPKSYYLSMLPAKLDDWGIDPTHEALAPLLSMQEPKRFEEALFRMDASRIDWPFAEFIKAANGGRLPEDISPSSQGRHHHTMIQLCAGSNLWRQAGSLMARGANANLFNCGVTAVGMAGYVGSTRTLAEMGAYGADLRLELRPEHAPPGDLNARRSTLLHRIAGRQSSNLAASASVLAAHASCYPDLLSLTDAGNTALDWLACPELSEGQAFKDVVLRAIARREAAVMSSQILAASRQAKSQSL